MAETPRSLARRGLATSVFTRFAVMMILAQTVLRCWQVLPGNYWMDDFAYLWSARHEGMDLDYLLQDYNGHLMPAGFALNWLMSLAPGSYLPAGLTTVAMQLVASVLFFLLVRRTFGETAGMLIALALYLFNPLMIASVTWWAASTQTLPLQVFMIATAYCHVRYADARDWRWLVAACACLVGGLAFWEKAVLIPWFVALISLLLVRGSVRETAHRMLRLWPAWVAYLALTATYAAVYLRMVDVGGAAVESVPSAARFARIQLVDLLLPSFFGGPWRASGFDGTTWPVNSVAVRVLLLQLLVVVAIVGWRLHRRRSLLAWAVIGGYVLVTMAVTLRGRGYWGDAVALDPRYASDIVPVVAFAVGYLLTFEKAARERWLEWIRARQAFVGILACLVIFNSSMISAAAMAELYHRDHVGVYVDTARSEVAKDPDLVVFDGFLPSHVMIPWFKFKYRHVSSALDAYDIHPRYDIPTEDLRVLDDNGVAREADLAFGSPAEVPARSLCGLSLRAGEARTVPMEETVDAEDWWMRIRYFTSGEGALEVTAGGDPTLIGLQPGGHHVFAEIDGPVSELTLRMDRGRGIVCITSVDVGYPIAVMP